VLMHCTQKYCQKHIEYYFQEEKKFFDDS
jgi:hypothetical protein